MAGIARLTRMRRQRVLILVLLALGVIAYGMRFTQPAPVVKGFPDRYSARNKALSELALGMTNDEAYAQVGGPDDRGRGSFAKTMDAPIYDNWLYYLSVDQHAWVSLAFDSNDKLVEIFSVANDVIRTQSSIRRSIVQGPTSR